MFDNIGGKIKSLALVVCWIGIISSVISGFVMMLTDEYLIFPGILVAAVGSLLSWIGSFMAYGFGQLIENSDILVAQGRPKKESIIKPAESAAPTVKYVHQGPVTEGFWACKKCGTHNKLEYGQCKKCGTYRS